MAPKPPAYKKQVEKKYNLKPPKYDYWTVHNMLIVGFFKNPDVLIQESLSRLDTDKNNMMMETQDNKQILKEAKLRHLTITSRWR